MGTIIRLILRLFGYNVTAPAYLSEVSKTVELLPVGKRWRWFWGGILHSIPVAIGLTFLLISRAADYRHGWVERVALLVTASWSFIGPALIWYYERRTLPSFLCECRKAIREKSSFRSIRTQVYSNVYSRPVCIAISTLWIALTLVGFLRVTNFVNGFGLSGPRDWLWWVILSAVILYAYYSSLGFCFIYKTITLTRLVVVSDMDTKMYNEDGVFGFSFIGDFALRTNLMFQSGIVFVPLILLVAQQKNSQDIAVPIVLIGIYIFFTVVSFAYPIYNVHRKIVAEKRRVIRRYLDVSNDLVKQIERSFSLHDYHVFLYYKGIASDIYSMREWPLNVDAFARFTLYAIIIPITVTIVAALLTPE